MVFRKKITTFAKNTSATTMNAKKVKAIAREMTAEEKAARDFRINNADWLKLSATIALKIRKLLRLRGISQSQLAEAMDVTPAQISKYLSGKVNFELKTIAKLQAVLGETLLEISEPVYAAEPEPPQYGGTRRRRSSKSPISPELPG